MKKDIHPVFNPKAKVRCACGAVFEIGSTKPELHIEICSKCHPFFTGKEKLIDTAGKVEKFKAKKAKAEIYKTARLAKANKKTSAKGGSASGGKKVKVKKNKK